MRRVWKLASILLALAASSGAIAHAEGESHLMGVLLKVGDDAIELKAKAGETVSIALDAKTEYLKLEDGEEVAATRADLQVDRRVVVDVEKRGAGLAATRVVIGPKAEAQAPGHEGHNH